MNAQRCLPIRYREFYDIPRISVVEDAHGVYLFDCPFDAEIDGYPNVYNVYRLAKGVVVPDTGSWSHLRSAGSLLAKIPTAGVTFDQTKRASIDAEVLRSFAR